MDKQQIAEEYIPWPIQVDRAGTVYSVDGRYGYYAVSATWPALPGESTVMTCIKSEDQARDICEAVRSAFAAGVRHGRELEKGGAA